MEKTLAKANDLIKNAIRKIENKDEIIFWLAQYLEQVEECCPRVPKEHCYRFDEVPDGCILCHIVYAQNEVEKWKKNF